MSIYPVLSEQAQESSDDGKEATPVPIPNTEVKLFCADGSWGSPPVRVGRCQSDSLFRSSSVVEHRTVNAMVVGSSPTFGAILLESCPSGRRSMIGNHVGGQPSQGFESLALRQ